MGKTKKAAHNIMSKAGHHDTTVYEQVAPAVKHETVKPTRHEEVDTSIDKEIHQDHYHYTVQPVKDTKVLPEQHRHRVTGTQHRDFDHRNHKATQEASRAEAGKLHNQRVVTDTTQTQSHAPVVQSERFHHHVYKTVQPLIEKEVIQPEVVHTTVPVHEVHHLAASHHPTTNLPPVSMNEFKKQGGTLSGSERYFGLGFPAHDIKHIIRTLIQGSPDEQHDTIYSYFALGAAYEHPFCRVPSFKNLHIPGVGTFDSRVLINAIYRWSKILSPKTDLEIESCVHDERANLIYLTIFQIFSIWFIPFHRAPVRLVTVLHLAPSSSSHGGDGTPPPPPYDAAQEKLHAVQEGAEPSYAAVTAGEASATTSQGVGAESSGSSSGSFAPTRYVITKQQDLYQVNEIFKFVAMTPGSVVAGFLQLLATLLCLAGSVVLGPFVNAVWPLAKAGERKGKKQR